MAAIELRDYDPSWPDLFVCERAAILAAIGDIVSDIHHIGSTSVVGLRAKPKIDIYAAIRNEERVSDAVERMRATATYRFHGTPHDDGVQTFTSARIGYGVRLYLCAGDNPALADRLLFRDWLRAHPSDAADYAALKIRLVKQAAGDWDVYTGGKSGFVADILRKPRTGGRL